MTEILVEEHATTVWVTLNRPDVRNALSRDVNLRLQLARILVSSGQKARARTELQHILGKEPSHKEAKSLLKSI